MRRRRRRRNPHEPKTICLPGTGGDINIYNFGKIRNKIQLIYAQIIVYIKRKVRGGYVVVLTNQYMYESKQNIDTVIIYDKQYNYNVNNNYNVHIFLTQRNNTIYTISA
jgi:hypothetical protein